jgi:hypothetical protein
MGVLYDIYCIPATPFSVDWSKLSTGQPGATP